MKRLIQMVPLGFTMVVCACLVASPKSLPASEPPPAEKEIPAPVVDANNGFAVGLYSQLSEHSPDDNLFFSPYSIYGALVMAAEGARGETLSQMAGALRFPPQPRNNPNIESTTRQIHVGLSELNKRLTAANRVPASLRRKVAELQSKLAAANKEVARLERGGNFAAINKAASHANKIADELNRLLPQVDQYELRVANALWGEKTYPFHPAFLAAIRKHDGEGSIFAVDFRGRPDAARQQINHWVAAQTNNRIRDIVPPDGVDANTRLALTNAVYFKGAWARPFHAKATADGEFTLAGGDAVTTPLMHQDALGGGQYAAFNGDGGFFNTPTMVPADDNGNDGAAAKSDSPPRYPAADGFTALSLPYKGGALSMVFLVPRSADRLPRIESQLATGALPGWLSKLRGREVHVFIPKFKAETQYELNEPLQALGMTRAFRPNVSGAGAQFNGISETADPAHRLFISQVLHKAFVETNEQGTEAAAVTAVLFPAAEAPMPRKMVPFTPTFRADKPFLFLIRHESSGAILFLGRIVNPH